MIASMNKPSDMAALLHHARENDREASERMFELVQQELHGLAEVMMRAERGNHTLQPTALVNEGRCCVDCC